MRRLKKFLFLFIISFSFGMLFSFTAKAEGEAEFRVQTTGPSEDGRIEVSVYIDDIEHIGGADLELQYDPEQVICVDSGLGETVSPAFYDVYHNQEKHLVKYVLLLPTMQDTSTPFLKASFQLIGEEDYQPVFRVVDLVDDTDEIGDVDYKILYQQADGTWAETEGSGEGQGTQEETVDAGGAVEHVEEENAEESSVQNKTGDNKSVDETATTKVKEETLQEPNIKDGQEDREVLNNQKVEETDNQSSETPVAAGSEGVKKEVQEEREGHDVEPEVEEEISTGSKKRIDVGFFLLLLIALVATFIFGRLRKKKRQGCTDKK